MGKNDVIATFSHRQKEKNISVFEKLKTSTIIDSTTGEIISETTTSEVVNKTTTEPDFIKIYYGTILAFKEMINIPLQFLVSISQFIEWSNNGKPMFITLNKRVKEIIQNDCNIKSAQVSRNIKICVENGVLLKTKYRGVYEVNPFMIAKGKWDSIKKLQCEFNFSDGKWIREIEFKQETDDKQEQEIDV